MKLAFVFTAAVILLFGFVLPSSNGSLLPFLDRPSSRPLSERIPDPFGILEHLPFGGLDRDSATDMFNARVDWKETPDAHHIIVDVPGLKKEEVKVEVDENRILRVSGERKQEVEKKGEQWHVVERAYGKFWRQFRLPDNADFDSIQAKLENGVLTIRMAKLSPEQVKKPRIVSIGGEEQKDEHKTKNVEVEL